MLYVPQEIVHETIIEIFKIFSHCQIASMATARFRPPKTEEEEISLPSETVPENTKYNTDKMGGERFYYLAEYENEQKSVVGNIWRQRT